MKTLTGCMALLLSGVVFAQTGNEKAPEPPMLGIHWARGVAAAGGQRNNSPLMTWHGGPVLPTSAVVAIFWGSNWSNTTFVGDKISGLETFYTGENGSNYADTADEYSGSNGQVSSTETWGGSYMDLSQAPNNGNRTSPILQEVCNVLAAHGVTPVANGYYPVYVDTPRGHAQFCAWHSWGACNNVPIQFAFFYSLDGDAGCDPEDTSGLHSQGLAALANVSGHELSEARTDPRGNAWYDSAGQENADKCAWTFGTPLLKFSNGSKWKVQGNWSNAAYTAGTGYPNSSGQDGCIDGGNYK